jgi:hypothetical protein
MMKPMKKFLCVCAALAMTLSAASAMAADVTGTWTGEVKAPDGSSFQLTFTFKQDGTTLTGTVLAPQGDPIPFTNGKMDGDKFSFDDSFNGITIHHNCTVDGNTIKMSTKSDSADFPGVDLTLTRKTDAPGTPTAPVTPTAPAQAPK